MQFSSFWGSNWHTRNNIHLHPSRTEGLQVLKKNKIMFFLIKGLQLCECVAARPLGAQESVSELWDGDSDAEVCSSPSGGIVRSSCRHWTQSFHPVPCVRASGSCFKPHTACSFWFDLSFSSVEDDAPLKPARVLLNTFWDFSMSLDLRHNWEYSVSQQ